MVTISQDKKPRNVIMLVSDRAGILTQVSESKSVSSATHGKSVLEDES